jgi:O6-methylguanine-DNA--protein-cysteine methyltransferase
MAQMVQQVRQGRPVQTEQMAQMVQQVRQDRPVPQAQLVRHRQSLDQQDQLVQQEPHQQFLDQLDQLVQQEHKVFQVQLDLQDQPAQAAVAVHQPLLQ